MAPAPPHRRDLRRGDPSFIRRQIPASASGTSTPSEHAQPLAPHRHMPPSYGQLIARVVQAERRAGGVVGQSAAFQQTHFD
jgi:hypothetical protein